MKARLWLSGFLIDLFLVLPSGGAELTKLRIAYTATTADQAAVVVTEQAGLFRKHGLDVSPTFIQGNSKALQAMLARDVAMVIGSGSAAVESRLAGADTVIIAGFLNTLPYTLVSIPEIKTLNQLKGMKIAVSNLASPMAVGLRLALAGVGLNLEKDVTLLQIGTEPDRLAALLSNRVQAAVLIPPSTLRTRKMAYITLLDMSQLNPFQVTGLVTTRSYIKSQDNIVASAVTSLADGIHFYKSQKEKSLNILGKFLKISDQESLEEIYREMVLKLIPRKPYPSLLGIQAILDELSRRDPKAKSSRPEDFVEARFVRGLDDKKFFDALYGPSGACAEGQCVCRDGNTCAAACCKK